jgi:hypothetical protein
MIRLPVAGCRAVRARIFACIPGLRPPRAPMRPGLISKWSSSCAIFEDMRMIAR